MRQRGVLSRRSPHRHHQWRPHTEGCCMSHPYSGQPLLLSGTLSTVVEDFKSSLEIDLDQDVSLDLLHALDGTSARIMLLPWNTPVPKEYEVMLHGGCLHQNTEDA